MSLPDRTMKACWPPSENMRDQADMNLKNWIAGIEWYE